MENYELQYSARMKKNLAAIVTYIAADNPQKAE
jgi:hypothetical protein